MGKTAQLEFPMMKEVSLVWKLPFLPGITSRPDREDLAISQVWALSPDPLASTGRHCLLQLASKPTFWYHFFAQDWKLGDTRDAQAIG